jgi:hypothetical protein
LPRCTSGRLFVPRACPNRLKRSGGGKAIVERIPGHFA